MTAKVPVTVLVSPSGKEWIEKTATEHAISTGAVLRACLAEAQNHPAQLQKRLEEAGRG